MLIFKKRLKEIRQNLGLTQEEVGKGIFVSKQEICLYENGKRTPPLEVLIKLANFLEVDFLYLVGLEIKIQKEDHKIVNLSTNDINIIEELKKNDKLYEKFLDDPSRTIAEINNKLNK